MSTLTEILKLLGTIGGLWALVGIIRDLCTKYHISPRGGQWRPLIGLNEAVLRSYEAHPAMGDNTRRVTDNDPLIWHFMALIQDAAEGNIAIYGKRLPARFHTQVPVNLLNRRNFSHRDYATLVHDAIEWRELAVSPWALKDHINRVPAILLR